MMKEYKFSFMMPNQPELAFNVNAHSMQEAVRIAFEVPELLEMQTIGYTMLVEVR